MTEVKKREGESLNSLLFRFRKKIKQEGVLKETKKRRFHSRPLNKRKKRLAAIYRFGKMEELKRLRKLSYFKER